MNTNAFVGLLMIACVVALVVAIPKAIAQYRRAHAPGVLASFADLRLTATELIEGVGPRERRHSLAGLEARVEDTGTMNRRLTATRMLALGPFALAAPKQLDDRSVYLTIEGPATAVMREAAMKYGPVGKEARVFAVELNMRARQATAAVLPAAPPPAGPPPGWYPHDGASRWWDGQRWTEHVR